MASRTQSISGRALKSVVRHIVYDVFEYFRSQKEQHNIATMNIAQITGDATGVSLSSINPVIREGTGKLFFSKKKLQRKKKVEIDNFTDCAIWQKIHSFYALKK